MTRVLFADGPLSGQVIDIGPHITSWYYIPASLNSTSAFWNSTPDDKIIERECVYYTIRYAIRYALLFGRQIRLALLAHPLNRDKRAAHGVLTPAAYELWEDAPLYPQPIPGSHTDAVP